MKRNYFLIVMSLMAAVCLLVPTAAQAEPLAIQDYWVLTDGYRGQFTNGGQMTMTYGTYPHITGDVFDVDWPGSTGTTDQFFNYSGGKLLYYGARFVNSYEKWTYVPDAPQEFLPAMIETGKSYTCTWSRQEYQEGHPFSIGYGSDSYTITVSGPFTLTVPAGTFTTYEFRLTNNWRTSSGNTGTSYYTYFLAKGIGWIKLIREGVTYDLLKAPPAAVTGAATAITTSSATLNGTVNPRAASTTVVFEYGTTTAYGKQVVAAQSPLSGATSQAVSAQATGLSEGTLYHFRVKASNSQGTVWGSDGTFTTRQELPPTVKTHYPSSVTRTSATLNAEVNPNGLDTTWHFEYGTSDACDSSTPNQAGGSGSASQPVSRSLTGLTPDTTYYYRIAAENNKGESLGGIQTLRTTVFYVEPYGSCGGHAPCYASIQHAAEAAVYGGTLKIANDDYYEDLEPGTWGNLIVEGGWNPSFSSRFPISPTSGTAISGALLIGSDMHGTVLVDGLILTGGSAPAPVKPTVTTASITNITTSTATCGGNVTSDGGASVTARGVCWSTSANPTTTNSKTTNGSGTGSFTSSITGLNSNTTYHVRAYAINSVGTSYGSDVSFKTPASQPTVTTTAVSGITATTATSGGNVTSDGGASVTARGVCWSTSANPTTSNSKTTNGSGTGSFTSSITGLNSNTTYHVRAYAINSVGTSYGSDVSFKTPAYLPTVTTTAVSGITATTATSGGNVTSDGGASVTARGVCWSTSANPTTSNSKTTNGSGTGSFTSSISGLSPATTYHVRAYATNSAGTGYGADVAFTTDLGMTFVLIPAGTFTMGSPTDEPGRWSDETQHTVTLTQSFYMQTTEVTQAQWEAVMGSNPSKFKDCPTCPVEYVSWNDIQTFITEMNKRGEGTYGLPTEAQWEYAARAGSTTAFYNGGITSYSDMNDCNYDPNLDKIGWYCYNSSYETHPVAQKTPNAWGLYDMSGNVWEWCQDWYGGYPSGAVTDPIGPSSGSGRVARGGIWVNSARECRSAYRAAGRPGDRIISIGFRLLRQP
jgi:formylglycine-generating enzyme required for sulfatase activity